MSKTLWRGWGLGLMAGLGGCGVIDDVQDAIDELTHPVLVEGVVTSIAVPEVREVAAILDQSDYAVGLEAEFWVGEAHLNSEVESVGVNDAEVTLCAEHALDLISYGDGGYGVDPETHLSYEPGAEWNLQVEVPGAEAVGRIPFVLPDSLDLAWPQIHALGEPLELDLEGAEEGYDALILVVLDRTGQVVWSNHPEDLSPEDAYDFARGGLEPSVTLPPEAFPESGPHLVGWAAMRTNEPARARAVNPVLSIVMVGEFQFALVRVRDRQG